MAVFRFHATGWRGNLFALLLGINSLGLVVTAIWFRCRLLGNIPGINGDEAWYGVRALELWEGHLPGPLQTPTGNLLNPFFLGPLMLLHLCFDPAVAVLRFAAVGSGVAALAVNWLLCRWVYDRPTAAISTVILAILPIDIAYSRFAWDASQSLLATLPVVYLSLAAARAGASKRQGWLIVAAILAQLAAVIVHPTNGFAAAAIAAAMAARLRGQGLKQTAAKALADRRVVAVVVLGIILTGMWAADWLRSPGPKIVADRLLGVEQLARPRGISRSAALYPRLFAGGTVYRYLAGSHGWFQWPPGGDEAGWGIDAVIIWGIVAAAAWLLWRSWKIAGRREDRVLIAAWALELAVFLLAAGSPAMAPGYERYAICLIVPGVLVVSRGAALSFSAGGRPWRPILAAAALSGWLMLADFQTHYFDFIRQTGGRAHQTFRTAAVEPKLCALQIILRHRGPGKTWLVAGEHWNLWPLRYLAWKERADICVVAPQEAEGLAEFQDALTRGQVWRVEFAGSEALRQARCALAGRTLREWSIADYGGEPVLCLVHAAAAGP
jgi:hypothetical protein